MERPWIYLDHAATTPLDPRVAEVMQAHLGGPGVDPSALAGNPSSLHRAGRRAREVVERARAQVASLLDCAPGDIVFTGSGTEADNLALLGVMGLAVDAETPGRSSPGHIIVSAVEHPAILETCRELRRRGHDCSLLPVDADGLASVAALEELVRPDTRLVSVMAANNVTGVLQPIRALAEAAHRRGALFHTDAVQAAGRIPLSVKELGVDLLSLSGHKIHGPQGTGALYVRPGLEPAPVIHGGGQERGLRSATENVAGLAGLGAAAEIASREMAREAARLVTLREKLWDRIREEVRNAYLIGHRYRRLPGHLCLGFAGLEGEAIKLLLALDRQGIMASTGSACSARHAADPSPVLQAMGFDPIRARGSLRVSLGRFTTEEEVESFARILPAAISDLKPLTTRRGQPAAPPAPTR